MKPLLHFGQRVFRGVHGEEGFFEGVEFRRCLFCQCIHNQAVLEPMRSPDRGIRGCRGDSESESIFIRRF